MCVCMVGGYMDDDVGVGREVTKEIVCKGGNMFL